LQNPDRNAVFLRPPSIEFVRCHSLQNPAITQANCEPDVSILCRQRFAVSYADFARVDHPSRREPTAVSLRAVIFVDESEERALGKWGLNSQETGPTVSVVSRAA